MDPIKVDFSGKGSDRSKEIVIPPEKAALKIVLSVVFALLTGAVAYYFMLPPLNPKAIEFYYFIGIIVIAFVVFLALLSGAFRHSEYVPYVKKKAVVPGILIAVLVLVVAVGYLVGCPFFRAKSYNHLMDVQVKRVFSTDIEEPNFEEIPKLDETSSAKIADKSLSDLAKLGLQGQYGVYNGTAASSNFPQINYEGRPVRLAMLRYANIIKWFTNAVVKKDAIPGYSIIDTANIRQKSAFDQPIRYSLADHFGRHVKRIVRFSYPTYLFDDPSFEIDDTKKPYWIIPRLDKTIGLFGGRDVIGIVLVDAETGECREYTIDEVKNSEALRWIDRVYADDLILEQFNYYGLYPHGFWNSLLGQEDCIKSTDGSNYIAQEDDVWLYTGVTSLTSDSSIVGFVLINQRTKEARYYGNLQGGTEYQGQEAAKGLAQAEGYSPTFPLLLNIGGEPTYFLSLKDNNQTVQQFSMVNVAQVDEIKVRGTSVSACLDNYLAALKAANVKVDSSVENINVPEETDPAEATDEPAAAPTTDTPSVGGSAVTGVVTEIRSVVIGGNTVYYLRLEGDSAFYAVSAAESEQAVILNKGDAIRAEASGSGSIKQMTKLEIVTE